VLIHPDFDGGKAGIKVAAGKFLNAGQTCLAPDYILLTSNQKDAFVTGVQQAVSKSFPTLLNNPDFTAIINERHQKRLLAHLKDAEEKGAQLITINPGNESTDNLNGKVLPTLVLNPTEEMTLMQEEIFGPILPVRVVDDMNAAVEYVNNRPRPLALYYFDYNTQRANDVLNRTTSGGAVINDVVFHVAQESLPFGGIGESGVGAYHGETGFLTFSHQKSVLYLSRLTTTSLFKPPYGALIDRALSFLLR